MEQEYDLDILFDIEHLDQIYNIYDNVKQYDFDSYNYNFDRIKFTDFYKVIKKSINIQQSIQFLNKDNENPYDLEDKNNEELENLSRKNLYVKTKKNKTNDDYK